MEPGTASPEYWNRFHIGKRSFLSPAGISCADPRPSQVCFPLSLSRRAVAGLLAFTLQISDTGPLIPVLRENHGSILLSPGVDARPRGSGSAQQSRGSEEERYSEAVPDGIFRAERRAVYPADEVPGRIRGRTEQKRRQCGPRWSRGQPLRNTGIGSTSGNARFSARQAYHARIHAHPWHVSRCLCPGPAVVGLLAFAPQISDVWPSIPVPR